jgi:hypothetical protein
MATTYRLLRDTSVVNTKDGKADIITIPAGSVITVREPPSKETGLVPIQWENTTARMFAVDLKRRAQPLDF